MEMSLDQLIRQRMWDLGIRRADLARRMGYVNIAKGCRRIDQICAGDLELAENLRIALSQGLAVDVEVIGESIEFTRAERIAAEDEAYRQSFKPHAVILAERRIPSPVFAYAMCGGARLRIIPFQEGSSPGTYAVQAREALPETVPGLGRPTGYVVNYSPDFALSFNKEGRLVGKLGRALRVGQSSVITGGREVGERTWSTLLGDVTSFSSPEGD